jgi:hypothetical protein
MRISVSPLEKFPGLGGDNSRTSKLAATSSNVIVKADTENAYARVGFVPTADPHRMNVGGNFRSVSVIDPRRDQRQLSHHCSHLWLNSYWQLSAHTGLSDNYDVLPRFTHLDARLNQNQIDSFYVI